MRVVLSIEACEKEFFAGKREVFFRTVEWDAIPVENSGAVMQFGVGEDGENGIVSAHEFHVYWQTNGTVNVGMKIDNLLEEYDDIVECIKRDGFLEFSKWKETSQDA